MSGWIKLDKKLTDSIRFRRVVRKVRDSNALRRVTEDDVAVSDEFYVTLVLGALVRLWVYADTHIDNDNTLDMTLDEIDELVGVDGFGQALPADWLQVVDSNRVQLPDFLAHNGSSEKQRRDNARRQSEYRHRRESRNVTRDVTASNASNDARPDQIREDQKKKEGAARHTDPDWSAIPNLDLESWLVWLAYRRKAGFKRYADTRMAKRLAGYPREIQAAAIDESITQNYQGVFPEKVKPNGAHQQSGHETAYERSGRRLREWAAANGVDTASIN